MQYSCDPVTAWRGLPAKRRFNLWAVLALAAVFALSYWIYSLEAMRDAADLAIHASIAADFDFGDLHSITSRLSYPVWHLLTSSLYQLGMPLASAAGAVTALMKTLTCLFAYWLISAMAGEKCPQAAVLGMSVLTVIVTGVRVPWVNPNVYQGAGSPNVWHNPTQQTVMAAMMLVVPWVCHCWYCFQEAMEKGCKTYILPWWKVLVLAVLTTGSVACKPTMMQALLPAAFVMYLVELCRHKDQWRYFGQIVLGFVPAVGYFLLSYLYYTGVVVEYTSGVRVVFSPEMLLNLLRGVPIMCAAPIAALITCWHKGMLKDRLLVLTLLMMLFSMIEGICFHETGMRAGHGNFTWAANSTAFLLWVVSMGILLRNLAQGGYRAASRLRRAGYWATLVLGLWHLASAVYYIWYIALDGHPF